MFKLYPWAKVLGDVDSRPDYVPCIEIEFVGPAGMAVSYVQMPGIACASYVLKALAHIFAGARLQEFTASWMSHCFGAVIPMDREERSHRFMEESLELVQSAGVPKEDVLKLVDYVYGRPVGEMHQEIGGVMVTLAAFCNAYDFDMTSEGHKELRRCWRNISKIRHKQAGKPRNSPLPQMPTDDPMIPEDFANE